MRIDVMQWNVWFKEDIDKVVDVIRTYNPDVICLQELTQGYVEQSADNTWEHIQHELGYYAVHQTIPINTDSDNWLQANAIFSRFPIISTTEHWLHTPKDLNDPTDQFRGYIEAVIDTGELQFTAGTAHMSFGAKEHDGELHELLKMTEHKERRYLFTADLNDEPESERVRKIGEHLVHAGPSFDQNTWTTKPHVTPQFEATSLDWRYDYVFATPDVEIVDARIIDTEVSDHLPIIVTAELH